MGIPWAPVTASDVLMNPYTIHGWRPTSVVTQPAMSATTESGPARTTASPPWPTRVPSS